MVSMKNNKKGADEKKNTSQIIWFAVAVVLQRQRKSKWMSAEETAFMGRRFSGMRFASMEI